MFQPRVPPPHQPDRCLLLELPPECRLDIADYLADCDLNSLARTNRAFYDFLNPRLYKRGARLKVRINPLFWATEAGILNTARYALLAGADVNAVEKSNGSETALHKVIYPWAILLGRRGGLQVPPPANIRISLPMAKLLLDSGANVNSQNAFGKTPLYLATYLHDQQVVELLVERGADVTIADVHGNTPLHLAASGGYEDTVRFLIANGADPKAQRPFDLITPLHLAVKHESFAAAKLLLGAGVDINIEDAYQQTPLHYLSNGYGRALPAGDKPWSSEMVRYLVSQGANTEAMNIYGETTLHSTIHRGATCARVAELLIQNGANIEALNVMGHTPLHAVVIRGPGMQSVVQCLLRHGADRYVRDEQGRDLASLSMVYSFGVYQQLLDPIWPIRDAVWGSENGHCRSFR
ncbi:ankyrin repeat-containing domain protein [Aspergillus crustosus]